MNSSWPGSSVHGTSQAGVLEWVTIPFSRGSSRLKDWICGSCIGRWIPYSWTPGKPLWTSRMGLVRNRAQLFCFPRICLFSVWICRLFLGRISASSLVCTERFLPEAAPSECFSEPVTGLVVQRWSFCSPRPLACYPFPVFGSNICHCLFQMEISANKIRLCNWVNISLLLSMMLCFTSKTTWSGFCNFLKQNMKWRVFLDQLLHHIFLVYHFVAGVFLVKW